LIIILTWREFKTPPGELLGTGKSQYTAFKAKSNKEMRVKSGYDGSDSDYEEGIPEIDERTLIRSKEEHEAKEINLRKIALNKLLVQVGSNQNGVDIGAGLENCLTKFDKKYLRYRRAFSMDGRMNPPYTADWDCSDAEASQEDEWEIMFEYQRERRYSWLVLAKELEDLPNPEFYK
jgi:hypothetical protein